MNNQDTNNLLLQLLSNPTLLQQVLSTIQNTSMPTTQLMPSTQPTPSNAIIGIVNTEVSILY
jgi:hypothetical protein